MLETIVGGATNGPNPLKPATSSECDKDEEGRSFSLFPSWDDNVIHDPLGAGSYIYQKAFLTSTLRNVGAIPLTTKQKSITIHIGAQPNNSPHAGTITVFTLAFLVARGLKREYHALCSKADPSITNELDIQISLDLVDTAPDSDNTFKKDDITYQKSHRATGAMAEFLPDYYEILDRLSDFTSGEIPYQVTRQENLLALPTIKPVLHAIIEDHERLGWELSPDRGKLGLRRACPEPGCFIADKHGMKTQYVIKGEPAVGREFEERCKPAEENDSRIEHATQGHTTLYPRPGPSTGHTTVHEETEAPEKHKLDSERHRSTIQVEELNPPQKNNEESNVSGAKIVFQCPDHGPYTCSLSSAEDIKLLEFNTPLRNLVRTLANGLDTVSSRDTAVERLHIRVTGADYSGGYQEQLLYRQLMIMPIARGLPPPTIIYTPLILDWAGSKLSKSLYVRKGAYGYLKSLQKDYLLSYSRMKEMGKDPMVLAKEVERWVNEPKKLFRHYTIEYLHRVFEGPPESGWGVGSFFLGVHKSTLKAVRLVKDVWDNLWK